MRWNVDNTSDLSPDLEWMLQSGQASRRLVAEALLEEFYPSVFSLALAYLRDEKAARTAARRTFRAALANSARYSHAVGVKTWLFRQAVQACRYAGFRHWSFLRKGTDQPFEREFRGEESLPGSSGFALWKAIQKLQGPTWMAVLLRCLSGFDEREIAIIQGDTEDEVRARLDQAWEQLQANPGQLMEIQAERIEQRLFGMLPALFPERQLTSPEIQRYLADIVGKEDRQARIATLGELLWTGMAILAALGLAWLSRPAAPNPVPTTTPLDVYTPNPTQTPDFSVAYYAQPGETLLSISTKTGISLEDLTRINPYIPDSVFNRPRRVLLPAPPVQYAPSPVPPLRNIPNPLTTASLPTSLKQRLFTSQPIWQTLWVDAQLINYGPPGYVGPSQAYRTQVWISLPDKSLQLVGPLGGTPFYRILVEGKYNYFFSQEREVSWYSETPELLASWSALPTLIFPSRARWLQDPGTFHVTGEEEIAGRKGLIADWFSPSGQRLRRLWIDVQTGLILRQQEYRGKDGQIVIADYSITAITYNASFPSKLFDPSVGGLNFAENHLGIPQPDGDSLQLTALAESLARVRLARQTAPPGLDPARSQLTFQYPDSPSEHDAAPMIDLFAGRFYLGSLPFADPWNSFCTRSPDGGRIAFTLKPGWQQGRDRFSADLHWFDLADLEIHSPPSLIQASSFAFAPDSQRLVIFGSPAGSPPGIDLLDMKTGEISRISDLSQAESLVWSPDGEQIALIGKQTGEPGLEALILDTSTGEIVYNTPIDSQVYQQILSQPDRDPEWPTSEWPGHGWMVQFPVKMGGLEACSAVPSKVDIDQ